MCRYHSWPREAAVSRRREAGSKGRGWFPTPWAGCGTAGRVGGEQWAGSSSPTLLSVGASRRSAARASWQHALPGETQVLDGRQVQNTPSSPDPAPEGHLPSARRALQGHCRPQGLALPGKGGGERQGYLTGEWAPHAFTSSPSLGQNTKPWSLGNAAPERPAHTQWAAESVNERES